MAKDIRAYTLAALLLECARERLAETEAGAPDNACVITGALAWDCSCSDLTVAITATYPSAQFPTPAANTASQFGAGRCGQPLIVVNMTVTMLRCVTGADENGTMPSCAALTADALIAVEDAAAVRDGVLCCLGDLLRTKDPDTNAPLLTGFVVGAQTMVGPAGSCAGSAMDVQLGILNRCAC